MPGVGQGGDCRTRMDMGEGAGVREAPLRFRRAEEGGGLAQGQWEGGG